MQAIAVEKHNNLNAVENDRLLIEQRETVRQRLKSRYAKIPANISLADALIVERRFASI